jgi:hypothetical protein
MRPCALLTAAIVLAVASTSAQSADVDIMLSPRGCQMYAVWSGNLVWASDLDAEKEKAREELVVLDRKTPASIFALMLKNLDALWTTTATWEEVTVAVLQDCVVRRGMYQTNEATAPR